VKRTTSFEIVTWRDSNGNQHDTAQYSNGDTHSDSNYMTEEEWQRRKEWYEEQIAKYDDSKNQGGSPFPDLDGNWFDETILSDIPGFAWLIAGGLGLLAAIAGLSANR